MANIPGTNVIAPVVPFSTDDVHPSHEARYGKGGYRTVATLQERDAIPTPRLEAGMLVYVQADGKAYQLGSDLTTWEEFKSGVSTWAELGGKPTSFTPTSHAASHSATGSDPITIVASQVSDFSSAVVAAAPPTTDASLLTKGTLPDARLSASIARTSDVTAAVAAVVDAAPSSLDTLRELATALGDDANFASTVTNAIAAKVPLSGGSMNSGAVVDFSNGTTDSEVGPWGFGVELTADTAQNATVEYNAITVHSGSGSTVLGPGSLTFPNGTQVAVGSFDSGLGGYGGISLVCAVGYELNWQAGRLRNVIVGGDGTPQTIYSDSTITVQGETASAELAPGRLTLTSNVGGGVQTLTIDGNTVDLTALLNGSPTYAGNIRLLTGLEFPHPQGVGSGAAIGYSGITFSDSSFQSTAWLGTVDAANVTGLGAVATSNAYSDLSGLPTLGTAAAANTGDFAAASHTHDDRYYTETEVDTLLAAKVGTGDASVTDAREWTADTISQAEAEAGTSTTRRAFTALRVFQAIAAWWASSSAKAKLDGVAAGATANQTDAYLLSRANHTGTQAASTITGLAAVATSGSAADLSGTLSASRLPATTVTAGSYGSASSVATYTVDAAGRLMAAGSTSIAISAGAVSGLASVATAGTFASLSSKPTTLSGYGITDGVTTSDSRLSDARTPTSHTHGNITNAGAIGSTSGQIVVTTTGGVLTTAASISASAVSGLGGSATLNVGATAGTVASGDHTHSQLHDRSHAITSSSDHTATAWRIFYSNGSGVVTELALGSSGQALLSGGASAAPSWGSAGSSSASDLTSGTLAYARMADPTVTSPSQITASQNDYASFARGVNRFSTNGAYNLTGMAAGNDGEVRVLVNVGTTAANTLTIKDQSASSTAANRFAVPWGGDFVISSLASVVVIYDATSSRWRVV